jgi:dipeptidyl-peptidase 4
MRPSPLQMLVTGTAAASAIFPASAATDMSERYARAAVLVDPQPDTLVLNEGVEPHWTGNGHEFWYSRQTGGGIEYMLVSNQGERTPAFDQARIAAAATEAVGKPMSAGALIVESFDPEKSITLTHETQRIVCELPSFSCNASSMVLQDPRQLRSPDDKQALFVRDHNVWLSDIDNNAERRLTDDGVEGYAWGAYPDGGLLSIPRQRAGGLPFPPTGFSWSPDGRFVVGIRSDERGTAPSYFLEAVPQDGSFRTKPWPVRQPMMGDAPTQSEAVVFNVATGQRVSLEDSTITIDEPMGWSADGTCYLAIARSADTRTLMLVEANAKTGAVRRLVTEDPPGFVNVNVLMYSAPSMRVIRQGKEVLWYSERDGYGHLYRYRVEDGKLLNAVTSGPWIVRDVLHVDEARERVVFSAVGRDTADPYRRRIYRVNFDGSDLRLLTPEAADHQIDGPPHPLVAKLLGTRAGALPVSPDGSVFVDTWSTLDQPPVTVLRSTEDGRVITPLETADASRLFAAGWRAPLPFVAKAADGTTDLYGVLYLPHGAEQMAPKSLPLVDAIYGGPQIAVTPHNFSEAWRSGVAGSRAASMAALGFASFVIDGRGTPLRSRAFHDAAYTPNFADAELDDHAVVVKQLTDEFSMLDPARVGIFGHSFGGYVSARAMLRHPDVFTVGVSSAGIHSATSTYSLASFLPPPIYQDGSSLRPTPQSTPENYRDMDNGSLASRLTGRLLLAYGDLDENAPFSSTTHLIDALIKADRRFDLLYLPNRVHSFAKEPYFQRRMWDYFVEHLLHELPPNSERR